MATLMVNLNLDRPFMSIIVIHSWARTNFYTTGLKTNGIIWQDAHNRSILSHQSLWFKSV